MTHKIDLHMHTTASDGELSPHEIVELAIKKKLKAIAITDHNTIRGAQEAIAYSKDKDIEVIPGVEINCNDKAFFNIHVLGFFVDGKNQYFNEVLDKADKQRQKKDIVNKMLKLGLDASHRVVRRAACKEFVKADPAKVACEADSDIIQMIENSLQLFFRLAMKIYVYTSKPVSIKEAIRAIRAAGGIPVLAHPGTYVKPHHVIKYFKECGGVGVETDYPYDSSYPHLGIKNKKDLRRLTSQFSYLAKKYGLIQSAGSDFHWRTGGSTLGCIHIPYEKLEELRAYHHNAASNSPKVI